MSSLCLGTFDVFDFHHISCQNLVEFVGFWTGMLEVIDIHCVSDELRRGCWSDLDLRKVIFWVLRVISLSLRLELNTLGLGTANITRQQVSFLLV